MHFKSILNLDAVATDFGSSSPKLICQVKKTYLKSVIQSAKIELLSTEAIGLKLEMSTLKK